MNKSLKVLAVAVLSAMVGACASNNAANNDNNVANQAVVTKNIQFTKANLPSSFVKGADVSELAEMEENGFKYFDANGNEADALTILKNNGINYMRVRLWVDPQDKDGNTYGAGHNDLKTTLALAKRIKALGVKFLLDFHYSDFWTDPGKQLKPKAWENYLLQS